MNYGLYISASGLSTQMAKQDALSNNLANVNTTAFKPDIFTVRHRLAARQEDNLGSLSSNELIERLGGGVLPVATRLNTTAASLERTDRPLDVGIEGEGFLLVRAADGPGGVRLTRDGRLAISPDGRLVTAAGGHEVLSSSEQEIRVDPAKPILIHASGTIVQAGNAVGQLGLVTVAEPSRLIKSGDGMLRIPEDQAGDLEPAIGLIRQEFLESSAVDPVMTMSGISAAARAVHGATTVIGYINEMMGRAINSLGRTA